MNAQQIGFWVGVLAGGFIVGGLCGLLPLLIGLKRQRPGLAWGSWISCVAAGLVLGLLLAVPVAIVFTVIILCLRKPERQNSDRNMTQQGIAGDAVDRTP